MLALLFGLAGLLRAGRMRNLRLVSFVVVWLTAEIVALFLLFGLWIVSGFGGRLHTEAVPEPELRGRPVVPRRAVPGGRTDLRPADRDRRAGAHRLAGAGRGALAGLSRPVIVLSRHAGPGDSFLLVQQLLSVYGRRPRVVMKASLQFDPIVDVLGHRLPNVFVQHRESGERIFIEQIERLARDLGDDGALVIFPEGANWTPSRWRRGIRRLERPTDRDLADRARQMPNVLPPRPGGTLRRHRRPPRRRRDLRGARRAGHHLVHRRRVPQVPGRPGHPGPWWRVPFDQVPRGADQEAQVQWLYDWWERIDTWITENRPAGGPAPVPAAALTPEDDPAGSASLVVTRSGPQ